MNGTIAFLILSGIIYTCIYFTFVCFFFKKNYVELLLKLIILDMLSEFCDRLFYLFYSAPGLKTEEMSRQKRLRELICIASINEECWELLAKIQKKKPSQDYMSITT